MTDPRPSAKFVPPVMFAVYGLGVAVARLGPVSAEFQALVLVQQPEIDYARQGVGSVDGGSPAGQDFHALHERRRNQVQVRHAVAVRRDQSRRPSMRTSVAVLLRPRRDAWACPPADGVVRRAAPAADELGHGVEGRLHRRRAGLFEPVLGDRDDRACRLEVRPRDSRSGHDDLLEFLVLSVCSDAHNRGQGSDQQPETSPRQLDSEDVGGARIPKIRVSDPVTTNPSVCHFAPVRRICAHALHMRGRDL